MRIVEKLRTRLLKAEESRADNYRELVRDVAAGKRLDPANVERVLVENHVSVATFESDVSALERYNTARETLRECERAAPGLSDAAAKLAAESRAFEQSLPKQIRELQARAHRAGTQVLVNRDKAANADAEMRRLADAHPAIGLDPDADTTAARDRRGESAADADPDVGTKPTPKMAAPKAKPPAPWPMAVAVSPGGMPVAAGTFES